MPFVTIKGSFHLCGKSAAGNPTGFQPDGDSMQFKPDKPSLLDRLERRRLVKPDKPSLLVRLERRRLAHSLRSMRGDSAPRSRSLSANTV